MSDLYNISSGNDNDGVEIIGDIRIVKPRQGCEDDVCTTFAGCGKATTAVGFSYADTDAYLGFYKGDIVEAYFKRVGRGLRIHCGANWAAVNRRLELNDGFKGFTRAALADAIRDRTVENAPLNGGPLPAAGATGFRPWTVETHDSCPVAGAIARSNGAGAQDRIQAWRQDFGARAWDRDVVVGAGERQGRSSSPTKQDEAASPRVFHLQLVDIVAFVGLGVLIAYVSAGFAFVLLRFVYQGFYI